MFMIYSLDKKIKLNIALNVSFAKRNNLGSHRDLAELGSVDAVGGGGYVPVVEENPPALVR